MKRIFRGSKLFKGSLAAVVAIGLIFGVGINSEKNDTQQGSHGDTNKMQETKMVQDKHGDAESELSIHFLDVGQGDATLIICDGEAMLVDAGDNNKGTAVQLYLKKQKVDALKYIVGTHPDADHIGGLDVIITKFAITSGEVWMPDVDNDTRSYEDVVEAITYRGYSRVAPEAGDSYSLGSATVDVLGPVHLSSESNDNSIVMLLTHGENRFLLMGDATEREEMDILEDAVGVKADVIKIGHHGSKYSTAQEFIDAVNPSYAVISVGDNSYGHPSADCLNKLREKGVELFRTDEQGSIIATSDGQTISWNCSPTESWIAGETKGK
ncbi:MAG: ComEC/Rec2 family competence protein [Lachnospiraceae bacterium]|nr:ComEC/Rec2 family competence protein [Lachnospiraceae bacterium]